eukprot:8837252-Pyramimonas_sp.AAC.1
MRELFAGAVSGCSRAGNFEARVGVGAERAPEEPELSWSAAAEARGGGGGHERALVDGIFPGVHTS